MIDTLIFDLDDTLYPESTFVESGYRAVARHLSGRLGLCEEEISCAMMTTYTASGRRAVLPMVIERFPAPGVSLSELVEVYRRHDPEIRLLPGYASLLKSLKVGYHLGILTDGIPEVQMRKIRRLGLDAMVDQVVCSWDHGQQGGKPSPLGFMIVIDKLGSKASRALYIGDNPEKDGVGAHAAGMRFVQVLVPGRPAEVNCPNFKELPEFVIGSLSELPSTLRRVGKHE